MEVSFIKVCSLFQGWHLESRFLSCGVYGYWPEPKLKICFWQNQHKSGKTSLFELHRFSVALKSGFAAQTSWFAVANLNFFTRGGFAAQTGWFAVTNLNFFPVVYHG
jgi:hypothetical protein